MPSHPMHHHHHILKTLQECEVICEHMLSMIAKKQDFNMRIRQMILLRDCADMCTLTVKYIARNSVFAKGIAGFCATVCETCSSECARFPDHESQHCANTCMICARECRAFAMT